MNKVYKVIWNKAKHCYEVVSELAKSQGKSSQDKRASRINMRAAAVLAAFLVSIGGGTINLVQAADVTSQAQVKAEQKSEKAAAPLTADALKKQLDKAGIKAGNVENSANVISIGTKSSVTFDKYYGDANHDGEIDVSGIGPWNAIAIGQSATVHNSANAIGIGGGAGGGDTVVDNSVGAVGIGTHTQIRDSQQASAYGIDSGVTNSAGGTSYGAGSKITDSKLATALGYATNVTNSLQGVALGQRASVTDSRSGLALGDTSSVKNSEQSVAIGNYSQVYNKSLNSVALGAFSTVNGESGVISVGHKAKDLYPLDSTGKDTYGSDLFRRVINVADGKDAHDVATVGQVENGYVAYDTNKDGVDKGSVSFGGVKGSGTELKNVSGITFKAPNNNMILTGTAGEKAQVKNSVNSIVLSTLGGGAGQNRPETTISDTNEAISIGNSNTVTVDKNSAFYKNNQPHWFNGNVAVGTNVELTNAGESVGLGSSTEVSDSIASTAVGYGSSVKKSTFSAGFGDHSQVESGTFSTAIGAYSEVKNAIGSVALGAHSSVDGQDNVVSVGSAANESYKKIVNMADGAIAKDSHDAVTGGQLYTVQQKADNSVQYDSADKSSVTFGGGEKGTALKNVNDIVFNVAYKNTYGFDKQGKFSFVDAGVIPGKVLTTGKDNFALGTDAVIGYDKLDGSAQSDKPAPNHNVVVGNHASIDGGVSSSVVIGNSASASNWKSNEDGTYPELKKIVAIGQAATADHSNATSIGASASVGGTNGTALGAETEARADNSTAVGGKVMINSEAENSVAIGGNSYSEPNGTGSIQYNKTEVANGAANSTIVGVGAYSQAKYGTSLGADTKVSSENGLALGAHARVNFSGKNSVALGANSEANDENVVSVGNEDENLQRKVVNVADGKLAEGSHDVVTGGQLFTTNENLDAETKARKNADQIFTEKFADYDKTGINGGVVEDDAKESGSVAIGKNSHVYGEELLDSDKNGVVSFGWADDFADNGEVTRRLIHVGTGINDSDAATVGQTVHYDLNKDNTINKDSVTLGGTYGTVLNNVGDIKFYASRYANNTMSFKEAGITPGLKYGKNVTDDNVVLGLEARISGYDQVDKDSKASVGESVVIGNNAQVYAATQSTAIGGGAQVFSEHGTALGNGARIGNDTGASVSLGANSNVNKENLLADGSESLHGVVSVGKSGDYGFTRRIINVADGVNDFDAVNKKQLNAVDSKVTGLSDSAVQYDKNEDGTTNYGSVTFKGAGEDAGTNLKNIGTIRAANGWFYLDSNGKVSTYDLALSDGGEYNSFKDAGLVAGKVTAPAGDNTFDNLVIGSGAKIGNMDTENSFAKQNTAVGNKAQILPGFNWGEDSDGKVTGKRANSVSGSSAFGAGAEVTGNNSSAYGSSANVVNDLGVAIGYNAKAGKSGSKDDDGKATAIGAASNAGGNSSTALGYYAQATVDKGTAVGANTSLGYGTEGSVALGANSKVDSADLLKDKDGKVIETNGVVSVGDSNYGTNSKYSFQRRIINVADGRLLANSHDAVTGGQLFTTNENLAAETKARTDADKVFTDKFAAYENAGVKAGVAVKNGIALGDGSAAGENGTTVGVSATAEKGATAFGNKAYAAENSVALGNNAVTKLGVTNAVVLGTNSVATESNTVSVGSKDNTRKITNVKDGVADTDAATVGQISKITGTDSEKGAVVQYDKNKNGTTNYDSVTFKGANGTVLNNVADIALPAYKGHNSTFVGSGLVNGVVYDTTANSQWAENGSEKTSSIAIGRGSNVRGTSSLAVGIGATVGTGDNSTVIANGTALGTNAKAGGQNGTAVGEETEVAGDNGAAFGYQAKAEADSTAIGTNATAGYNGAGEAVAIGKSANVQYKQGSALGNNAKVLAEQGTALGYGAQITWNGKNSVALGAGSIANDENVVSVGRAAGQGGNVSNPAITRRIVNVAAGVNDTDAVNKGQMDAAIKNAGLSTDQDGTVNVGGDQTGKLNLNNDGSASLTNNKGDKGFFVDKDGNNTIKGNTTIDGTLTFQDANGNKDTVATGTDISGIKNEIGVNADGTYKKIDNGAATVIDGINMNAAAIKTNTAAIKTNTDNIGATGDKGALKLKNGEKTIEAGINKNTADIANNAAAIQQNKDNIMALGGAVSELDTRVDQVGAGAAALAALHPLDYDPANKWDFAAGYGHYKGASAVSVGTYYRPNENTMFSVGGSFGGGENMVNAGVSFKFGDGKHDSVGTSRAAMAAEINSLKDSNKTLADNNKVLTDKVAAQDKKLADYDQKMKDMEAKLEQLLKAQKQ